MKNNSWAKSLFLCFVLVFIFSNLLAHIILKSGYLEQREQTKRGYLLCENHTKEPVRETAPRLVLPNPESGTATAEAEDGSVLWSYNVEFDKLGRRQLPKSISPKSNLLILGDSFSFGTGVNNSETYSYLLASAYPDIQFYNYAYPGFGLNDYLDRLSDRSLQVDDIKGPVDVVLVTAGRMLMRSFCPHWCFTQTKNWWPQKSRYTMKSENLVANGSLAEDPFIEARRFFFRFPLGELYFRNFAWSYSEEQNQILIQSLVEIKKRLSQSLKIKSFRILVLPGALPNSFETLSTELTNKGFTVDSLSSDFKIQSLFTCEELLSDGHPNQQGQQVLFRRVEEILRNRKLLL